MLKSEVSNTFLNDGPEDGFLPEKDLLEINVAVTIKVTNMKKELLASTILRINI
jgi:hypothetical protein